MGPPLSAARAAMPPRVARRTRASWRMDCIIPGGCGHRQGERTAKSAKSAKRNGRNALRLHAGRPSRDHDTLDAVLEDPDVEVDDEREIAAIGSEVGDDPRHLDRSDGGDRLELDDELVSNEEVEAAPTHESLLVVDCDVLLSLEWDLPEHHFDRHCLFVYVLEKSRTEMAVHLDRGADHGVGESVGGRIGFANVEHNDPSWRSWRSWRFVPTRSR